MTIFINYRVFDFNGQYIGATGVGLTIDAVHRLIRDYQQRYQRTIYFVDARGQVVLSGDSDVGVSEQGRDLRQRAGLAELVDTILAEKDGAYEYQAGGSRRLLNVHAIPELHWYLFVEKDETVALAEIRHTLYLNLLACLVVTLVVLVLAHQTLRRYQQRMETLASTDELTGLLNRRAFTFLIDKFLADYQRQPRPMAMLLIDVDHFKAINDHHGHVAGDLMLAHVASLMQRSLRRSDLAVRWGGEEFLVVLKGCDLVEAGLLAEKLRQTVEQDRYVLRNEEMHMTVSIGVSEFDGKEAPDQAINRADLALYEAKRSGRNCVRTTGLPRS
jgi:diguanylate cyclase (GGDEF)-like protein